MESKDRGIQSPEPIQDKLPHLVVGWGRRTIQKHHVDGLEQRGVGRFLPGFGKGCSLPSGKDG